MVHWLENLSQTIIPFLIIWMIFLSNFTLFFLFHDVWSNLMCVILMGFELCLSICRCCYNFKSPDPYVLYNKCTSYEYNLLR